MQNPSAHYRRRDRYGEARSGLAPPRVFDRDCQPDCCDSNAPGNTRFHALMTTRIFFRDLGDKTGSCTVPLRHSDPMLSDSRTDSLGQSARGEDGALDDPAELPPIQIQCVCRSGIIAPTEIENARFLISIPPMCSPRSSESKMGCRL